MDWKADEIAAVNAALEAALPPASVPPSQLHRAMRYSVQAGGKRLRPLLCRAAARAIAGADVEAALIPACAVELIHTYSLIHDDLPALDNDDLRRGQPTCHKAFGEALAILAGDALLTLAFAHLATAPAAVAGALVAELAAAAGTPGGMVAGQVADVEASADGTLEALEFIHRRKTAALLRAAVVLGGLSAGATPQQSAALAAFGEQVGLAFQIVDDLLDVTGSSAELGKTAGKDNAQNKLTYPALVGLAAARAEADRLGAAGLAALAPLGASADRLRQLADSILYRSR